MKHNRYYEFFLIIRDLQWVTGLNDQVRQLLTDFNSTLNDPVFYMLEGRFNVVKKTKIKNVNSSPSNPDLQKLLKKSNLAVDKKKGQNVDPLDMIKAFKVLEQQLYHNGEVDKSVFAELKLGPFTNCLVKASDSIPRLLLCIPSMDAVSARAALSILHTSICIYRQFKVKAKPNASTITDLYNGTLPINKVIEQYFNDENIDRFISKYLNLSELRGFNELFVYSGNASSPNSGHSSVNYLKDVAGLIKDKDLYENVISLALQFKNGSNLKNIVDILAENVKYDPDFVKDQEHSRIVTFSAPGGKS
jgi:hypothetical protein